MPAKLFSASFLKGTIERFSWLCLVSSIDFEQTLITRLHLAITLGLFHWFMQMIGWHGTISLAFQKSRLLTWQNQEITQ